MKSVWSIDAVSEYPLSQPMVGQEKFYHYFKNFIDTINTTNMARIFPLIADWGIGKSRIGFELISEVIGKDKGWVVRGDNNNSKEVTLLKDNFENEILPIYISYNDMNHEDLGYDSWVAFGTYIALKGLANHDRRNSNIQSFREKVASDLVNHLKPMGFSEDKLKNILRLNEYSEEDVLDKSLVDEIINEAHEYFKDFGINHFMI
ncbi:MAG: hypothetical protein ACOCRO_05510, partial [Halanaerobiales bacterium]